MRFLKRFRTPKATFSAALSPDEPFFAVGDLHGRADLLERLLPVMRERAPQARRVFLGDFVDRGEESAQVLTRLRTLQAEDPSVICLLGNHEDMMLKFLDDPAKTGGRWLRYGGLQTLASYRVKPVGESAPAEEWQVVADALRAAIGPELESWLRELPTHWVSGNVAAVHAGADPALPIQAQVPAHLTWGHPEFDTTPRTDGVWVVHGHTIVDAPATEMGRISIDTGAYATGRLTAALIAPGQPPEFLVA